jgi:glycosyltransferase involved in cell wall biosynthesis
VSGIPAVEVHLNIGKGPGAARNLGIDKARHELIGLIDSDCIADNTWMTMFISAFLTRDIHALQGNPCVFRKDLHPLLGSCEERLYQAMFSAYVRDDHCLQLDTRNCALRKTLLGKIDGSVFVTDMCQAQAEARVCGKRLVAQGVTIGYLHSMRVRHKDPTSLLSSMSQKRRHGSGRIYVWDRTPSFGHLFRRYFWIPIVGHRVPCWYVLPTHAAFLWGYFRAKARAH